DKETIKLESDNGKESYSGGLDNIILIQSASNYIEIFFRDGASVRKQLIRQTLSKVEESISGLPNMIKCHRCTIVNIDQINRLTGSSPNVSLEIDGLDFRIPVSRQRVGHFRKLIASK
ncbi:MAG: LytTR family transcriptional regulator DNA-binding domain-containing protein, partial [Bacteroidales bacterium]